MASGTPPHFRLQSLSTGILLYRSEVQIVNSEQTEVEFLIRLKVTNTFKHVFDAQRLEGNISHFYAHSHEILIHLPRPNNESATNSAVPINSAD